MVGEDVFSSSSWLVLHIKVFLCCFGFFKIKMLVDYKCLKRFSLLLTFRKISHICF